MCCCLICYKLIAVSIFFANTAFQYMPQLLLQLDKHSLIHDRDVFGECALIGDSRWAGTYGVCGDFISRDNCRHTESKELARISYICMLTEESAIQVLHCSIKRPAVNGSAANNRGREKLEITDTEVRVRGGPCFKSYIFIILAVGIDTGKLAA